MANTKYYSIRERIIDKCLQERRGTALSEMMRLCNKELDRRGFVPVTSKQTILYDLDEIENKYNVVIERIKSGRYILYRYRNSDFSIYSSELSEEEYKAYMLGSYFGRIEGFTFGVIVTLIIGFLILS